MAELRALFENLGFPGARSLLQSGNLVFECKSKKADELERLLESETASRLKVQADYFVRTAKEWSDVVAQNPFPREAAVNPGRLLVMALKTAPTAAHMKTLRAAIMGRETVEIVGRHGYFIYPDGVGTSKLTARVIETRLETRGTARNWNTVLKLKAMVERE